MVKRYRALSFLSTDVGAFQSSFLISQTAQGLDSYFQERTEIGVWNNNLVCDICQSVMLVIKHHHLQVLEQTAICRLKDTREVIFSGIKSLPIALINRDPSLGNTIPVGVK